MFKGCKVVYPRESDWKLYALPKTPILLVYIEEILIYYHDQLSKKVSNPHTNSYIVNVNALLTSTYQQLDLPLIDKFP